MKSGMYERGDKKCLNLEKTETKRGMGGLKGDGIPQEFMSRF